jgi:hypothetical protein
MFVSVGVVWGLKGNEPIELKLASLSLRSSLLVSNKSALINHFPAVDFSWTVQQECSFSVLMCRISVRLRIMKDVLLWVGVNG